MYNPASADIHLLTPFAHRLLHLAGATACTLDTLTELLAADLAIPVDPELRAAVESAVTSLDRVGLLSPLLSSAW